MKTIEGVLDSGIRSQVDINSMQLGFLPGWDTTDTMFIIRQLQENYLGKHKPLQFVFVDSEKAFDHVLRKVLCWAMRRVRVEVWIIHTVKAMYENAKPSVPVNGQFIDEFNIKVSVPQSAVLSPLLFVIIMEALSKEFRVSCPGNCFTQTIWC